MNLRDLTIKKVPINTLLPESLCNCKNLTKLYLEGNGNAGLAGAPTGTIPTCLKRLSKLQALSLRQNLLTGSVPNLPLAALSSLDLSENKLTGKLPEMKGQFLWKVEVQQNLLSCIGNFSAWASLEYFDASDNKIDSTLAHILPAGSDGCQKLKYLSLTNNKLHGTIPEDLLAVTPSLYTLKVGNNLLNGPIPEMLACYDPLCGNCRDNNGNKNLKNQECPDLAKFCGDTTSEFSKIVRTHCRSTCGTFLQELQLHSNRLESPLPKCLAGEGYWDRLAECGPHISAPIYGPRMIGRLSLGYRD